LANLFLSLVEGLRLFKRTTLGAIAIVARVVTDLEFATAIADPDVPTQRRRPTLHNRTHRRKLFRRAVMHLQIVVKMQAENVRYFQRWLYRRDINH